MNSSHRPRFPFLRSRAFCFGIVGLACLILVWGRSLFISTSLLYSFPASQDKCWAIGTTDGYVTIETVSAVVSYGTFGVFSRQLETVTPVWWPDEVWSESNAGMGIEITSLTLPLWPFIFLWLIGWLTWMKWQARRRAAHLYASAPPADD